MEYSIEISRCIKKGILTKAMLAKKYSDTGGILTEKDAQRLVDLYSELSDLELEMSKRGSAPNAKQGRSVKIKKGLGGKIAMARRERSLIWNPLIKVFLIILLTLRLKIELFYGTWFIWLMLNQIKKGKRRVPLFEGKDFEQQKYRRLLQKR